MSRFDWYQATIKADPMVVLQTISRLGDETISNDRVGKMYRFTQGFEVHKHGNPVAYVALGSRQDAPIHAHAWATSDNATAFADLVRNEWPEDHLVTRLDSCHDFIDATAFPRLCKIARRVAKGHRVAFPRIQDDLNPTAGVTQYLGSPSSEYRGRIYEKGWEVVNKSIALGPMKGRISAEDILKIRVPDIDSSCHPSEWVRLELQARPKEETARTAAAHATPDQVWTFTSWSHELARDALALDLERFYVRQRKVTTDERALRFMCQQYGNMLTRLHDDLGDWSCVGLQIEQTLKDLDQQQRDILGHG